MSKSDRRKLPRYIPRQVAYVATRPYFNRIGRIKELNKQSMSFEYLAQEGHKESWNPIDIFLSEPAFYFPGVPCKVIYDIIVDDDEDLPLEFKLRRCGVIFENITEEQADKLDYFIKNYAIKTGEGVSVLPIYEEVPLTRMAEARRKAEVMGKPKKKGGKKDAD